MQTEFVFRKSTWSRHWFLWEPMTHIDDKKRTYECYLWQQWWKSGGLPSTFSIWYLDGKDIVLTKLHAKETHSTFQIANQFSITEIESEVNNKEIKGVSNLSIYRNKKK